MAKSNERIRARCRGRFRRRGRPIQPPELVFREEGGHHGTVGAYDVLDGVRYGHILGWNWTNYRTVPCQQRNGSCGSGSDDVWVWIGAFDLGAVE